MFQSDFNWGPLANVDDTNIENTVVYTLVITEPAEAEAHKHIKKYNEALSTEDKLGSSSSSKLKPFCA